MTGIKIKNTVRLWQLFEVFFKIGGFTFGGGYAMLPLIQREMVDRMKWLTNEEFMDLFAVAQSLPGVFAVNISIFTGYRLKGFKGALFSAIGCTLPSFLIILAIALFFEQMAHEPVIVRIFNGIRPVVVAMIAAPVITTWKSMKMKQRQLWIPILAALLVWLLKISPVWVIIISALGGVLYTFYIKKYMKPHIR
ncbi:chromate transporter [Porphyromonas macacae]|uniref:chromate transporter n=1 Tax=Porphyromonas macacae TaxID=28115 RepID=UPI0024AE156E|nr:chromate transporter [Porphyromonas macacae]